MLLVAFFLSFFNYENVFFTKSKNFSSYGSLRHNFKSINDRIQENIFLLKERTDVCYHFYIFKETIQLLRQNNTGRKGMYYYSSPDQKWLNEKYCGNLFINNIQIIDIVIITFHSFN